MRKLLKVRKPSPALVVAMMAFFAALGSSAQASHLGSVLLGHGNTSNDGTGITGARVGTILYGFNTSSADGAIGLQGRISATSEGTNSAGVRGFNNGRNGNGYGVWGTAASVYGEGTGVFGEGVYGVRGRGSTAGVAGGTTASYGTGVSGTGYKGVYGATFNGGYGVYGDAFNCGPGNWCYAGYFGANVHVAGTLSKAGGSFKIDHPLAPASKYLSHSFVESPDMMNVYNGNVVSNAEGFATVRLPRYFQALNRDFRYQLTVIDKEHWTARAAVWQKIARNRFTIRTDAANVEVSWQVTGIRKDRYANAHRIKVEEPKVGRERGRYLNPEVFGKPRSLSVNAASGARPTP